MTVITAGETQTDVWCAPCNAPVAVRVPLHLGSPEYAPAAYLTVCASCGTRYMPSVPVVTLTRASRWRRPRPVLALLWWAHRRDCRRRDVTSTGCALGDCPRPGWWDCAWYEAVDEGRIRWLFCTGKHRDEWLQANGYLFDDSRMAVAGS